MSVEGGMTSRARVEGEKRGEPMSQWTFGGGVSEGSHVVRNAPWNFVGTCAFSVFREIMGYTGALDLTPPQYPQGKCNPPNKNQVLSDAVVQLWDMNH